MTLTGGKRKVNKGLKSWVAFVKRVQKEEKLSYKDAIHRAKVRKDKGEKWMFGGGDPDDDELAETNEEETSSDTEVKDLDAKSANEDIITGGRRTRRRRGSSKKSKKSRKTKRRRSRKH